MVFDRMKHEKTKKYSSVIFTLLIFWTFLLSYYWWYLSSENIDFSIQVNQLNEQLKMSIEERNQCVTLRMKLEQRYKQMEDDIAYLHIKLEKQNNIQKKNDELKNSMTICKSKLHSLSILNAKLKENERFQKELEKVKDELVKLKLAYNAPANNIKSNPTLAPEIDSTIENSTIEGIEDDEIMKDDVDIPKIPIIESIFYIERKPTNETTN
ncbi:uncharacterized protein LOC122636351 isoform X2 [Vespula pensylvanica]|uniref:uncharacterized protein LOC122636351 isoform X2 n=1 Tax=Vespula pensylvanica TaxID=30213 RepID=UPI001CBA35D6|nr:uncharacterized protein LOC122636351 isoform X2 [Vespula pensylvanica]